MTETEEERLASEAWRKHFSEQNEGPKGVGMLSVFGAKNQFQSRLLEELEELKEVETDGLPYTLEEIIHLVKTLLPITEGINKITMTRKKSA